jgi:CBS domain-containing protein
VSDRDVLRAASRIEELTAADALGGELLEVHPDERLADVAPRMATRGTSHALVVDDRHGRPIGVLSTLDVAGILAWGRA